MTLGQLIGELERIPAGASVSYDEGGNPGRFCSYRGYYDQLALTFSNEPCTVARLLEKAKEADGGVFTGWKGGEYTMSARTPVWADEEGDYSSRAITATTFDEDDNLLTLCTAYIGEYA